MKVSLRSQPLTAPFQRRRQNSATVRERIAACCTSGAATTTARIGVKDLGLLPGAGTAPYRNPTGQPILDCTRVVAHRR